MNDLNDLNKAVIEEFRANYGKMGGQMANMSLVLLHTTGARSRLPRVNPLAYMADRERLMIIASKAGAPTNPDWYYNLVANPEVSIEVGTEQYQARATVTTELERTELYEKMATLHPIFADYQSKTTRVIPVVILTRLA